MQGHWISETDENEKSYDGDGENEKVSSFLSFGGDWRMMRMRSLRLSLGIGE